MATTALKRPDERKAARRRLRGPEKAAILFLCLGEKRGSELMQKLEDRDIQRITRAMTGLGMISSEQVEEVMGEYTDAVTHGGGIVGSYAAAEAMLSKFLPATQVSEILKEAGGLARERDMWKRFGALNESVIANYLKGEHEQTAAAILSNVQPDVAARVLPLLGPEKMQDIAERMISMEAVPLHMMRQIEETLKSDIMADAAHPTATDMQQRMADLFNKLDRDAFDRISPALEERVPEAFGAIKQKMFTFEDLVKLEAQDLARVMRGVDGNVLPLSLRGASKDVRDHFLSVLPARSRDMLLDEMSSMGPVRGRDVRVAQAAMVDFAKELAEDEEIRLPLDDDDDELIE
ncbi:flagellar motor switch protein FliG [Tranquillimonas alkanivorans]|uniref:Flagellar motor switch protein FliG n=1 Tax=Tranquillimonas alkanivorans TaxID=441119 RepID=A0A1I5S490_9RHOB|nr:flagellar motor switch protein FliG [Tranquillimonas alkanivorans]SFP65517.1 flagellar motor switch protein FliG [Tranquillimonas alkanivorans]